MLGKIWNVLPDFVAVLVQGMVSASLGKIKSLLMRLAIPKGDLHYLPCIICPHSNGTSLSHQIRSREKNLLHVNHMMSDKHNDAASPHCIFSSLTCPVIASVRAFYIDVSLLSMLKLNAIPLVSRSERGCSECSQLVFCSPFIVVIPQVVVEINIHLMSRALCSLASFIHVYFGLDRPR